MKNKALAELAQSIGAMKLDSTTEALLSQTASILNQPTMQAALREQEKFARAFDGFDKLTRATQLTDIGAKALSSIDAFRFPLDPTTHRMLTEPASAFRIGGLDKTIEQFNRLQLDSGVWGQFQEFAEMQEAFLGASRAHQLLHSSWLESRALTPFSMPAVEAMLHQELQAALSLTELAAAIQAADREAATILHGPLADLAGGVQALTASFRGLVENIPEDNPFVLPRVAIEDSPKELFLHTVAVLAVTSQPAGSLDPEANAEAESLADDIADELPRRLERLGHHFARKLRGARAALLSSNPDRVAHAAVSLRELIKAVLFSLAPAEQVKAFTAPGDILDDGSPTYDARMRYITRKLNRGKLASFLSDDRKAARSLLTALSGDVHPEVGTLAPRLSAPEMQIVLLRTEHFLVYLLRIADTPED